MKKRTTSPAMPAVLPARSNCLDEFDLDQLASVPTWQRRGMKVQACGKTITVHSAAVAA